MKLNEREKMALYAFGCTSRELTVRRLRLVAACSTKQDVKTVFFRLSWKLADEETEKWYPCFQSNLTMEMEEKMSMESEN